MKEALLMVVIVLTFFVNIFLIPKMIERSWYPKIYDKFKTERQVWIFSISLMILASAFMIFIAYILTKP